MEKICVAVRLRPPASQDSLSLGTFWKIDDNRISLHRAHGTPISGLSYAFDHVFDESCTNSRVYDLLTKDIIHAAVEGFNGTAFAYGQTSSGKTFTMNGSETDPGIIHRAVKDIFGRIQMVTDREFLIRVSYMEIYNEEINDLFAVENQKLQIHESLDRGIFVAGLREEIVNNAEQVLRLIERGEVNRHFGETNMNARSSRSHTIFRMVIESKGKDPTSSDDYSNTDAIRVSVLNLVDLAGSERIAKTGAGGVRLKEGKHINKSLMVLGNVINKLSEGAKQRGHVPYRDSKLTRILQPALGGNAKTSIICTISPEEIHVEETKGTLQFASRAKRITNCVQVNEILTDTALMKRQQLEIEELRKKLQGSHSEVLEQEVLKLRNDLLKYELEREKLEMELQQERNSHKEREQCIREQQMKIDNLSSLVTLSEPERNFSQGEDSVTQTLKEECSNGNIKCQGDSFTTPCFKAAPNSFVVKRSTYSMLPDNSPLPDTFSNVADEDMWLKMNKGFIADLDTLQMTPARDLQSSPSFNRAPDFSNENPQLELEDMKRQLELAILEKNELKKKFEEQVLSNNQLMEEISELKQEARLAKEIPQTLSKSMVSCKDIYEDVLSTMKNLTSDGEMSKFLSSMSQLCTILFNTLEAQLSMASDGKGYISANNSFTQEQGVFHERLFSTIRPLIPPISNCKEAIDSSGSGNNKGSAMEEEFHSWKEDLSAELKEIRARCHDLEQELDSNNKLLENYKQKYESMDREFLILKDEKYCLIKTVSESSQTIQLITEQKENALKDLNSEVQRRRELLNGIKEFSVALARRQSSFSSFSKEVKSRTEKLKAQNVVGVTKYLGSN